MDIEIYEVIDRTRRKYISCVLFWCIWSILGYPYFTL